LKPAVERALRATVSNLEAMFASSIGPTARS
jgi:hypothetical protein